MAFNKYKLIHYFFISASLWCIPFFFRLFLINNIDVSSANNTELTPAILNQLSIAHAENNHLEIFTIILKNNLKSCIYMILGGVMLGFGTIVNLVMNGFITADVFFNVYRNGMGINQILKHTLPHSFEIIGIWLSGALGIYIAVSLIDFLKNNSLPSCSFYRFVVKQIFFVIMIIALSAFMEAFVSTKLI